jgi:pimeloyl-ACP methyl ester carboxylesterase
MQRNTSIIVISLLVLATIYGSFFHLLSAESQTVDPLPIILIHGYRQDASSWNIWLDLLKDDRIAVYPITFKQSDDSCGSTADHARELGQFVEQVKQETHSEKVNLVGFSKGGLDARVYLQDGNNNVANLIMIGTPNGGAPLAFLDTSCTPAADDMERPTQARQNHNTMYYTIYGDWLPIWYDPFGFPHQGNYAILGPDDGLVPPWSVNSENYFKNIDKTYDHHLFLQTENEFSLACPILLNNNQCDQITMMLAQPINETNLMEMAQPPMMMAQPPMMMAQPPMMMAQPPMMMAQPPMMMAQPPMNQTDAMG